MTPFPTFSDENGSFSSPISVEETLAPSEPTPAEAKTPSVLRSRVCSALSVNDAPVKAAPFKTFTVASSRMRFTTTVAPPDSADTVAVIVSNLILSVFSAVTVSKPLLVSVEPSTVVAVEPSTVLTSTVPARAPMPATDAVTSIMFISLLRCAVTDKSPVVVTLPPISVVDTSLSA